MSSFADQLKSEIARIARKEVRAETRVLKKANAQYRTEIAALKRRLVEAERALARLGKEASKSGGRSRKASGVVTAAQISARVVRTARQSCVCTSSATSGDMVSGASPILAETSETARPRCVVNQPMTVAIMGAKKAATAAPASPP